MFVQMFFLAFSFGVAVHTDIDRDTRPYAIRPPVVVPESAHIPWLTEKTKKDYRQFLATHERNYNGDWVQK